MIRRPIGTIVVLCAVAGLFVSCGGNVNPPKNCMAIALSISPASATADHTAMPPGNQAQFTAMEQAPEGCAIPLSLPVPTWTTSDTANTSINKGPANPTVATCTGSTAQPATITATNGNLTGTATLTCK